MKPRLLSILFTLLLGIISCCIPQPVVAQTVLERIQVQPGPEDMVLDTSRMGPRLIISCCGRREIHKPFGGMVSLDLRTGEQYVMKRMNEPEGIGGWNPLLYASSELGQDIVEFCAERIGKKAIDILEGRIEPFEKAGQAFMDNPGPTD